MTGCNRNAWPDQIGFSDRMSPEWAAEPRITALVILGRLAERCPSQFGPPQHTMVQRLLKAMRRKAAAQLITSMEAVTPTEATIIGPETGKEVLPLSPASIDALPSAAEGILGNVL